MLEIAVSRMLYPGRASLLWMTLAQRVKEAVEAAKENGHSVAKIAAACGISPQAVYQWLKGDTKEIDGSNVVELAELSGYHAIWIMKGKGKRSDPESIRRALALLRRMTPDNQATAVKIITPLADEDQSDVPAPDELKKTA
jgi:transposase-like protein